jgi:hypothetical protein
VSWDVRYCRSDRLAHGDVGRHIAFDRRSHDRVTTDFFIDGGASGERRQRCDDLLCRTATSASAASATLEDACNDLRNREAVVGGALIEVRAMRLRSRLAPCEAIGRCDRCIGNIIKREERAAAKWSSSAGASNSPPRRRPTGRLPASVMSRRASTSEEGNQVQQCDYDASY